MNKEEKEAVDILQNSIADYVIGEYCEKCGDRLICEDRNEDCYFLQAIDKVVNLIDKLQKRVDEYEELFGALEDYYEITKEDIRKCIKEDI